jgi:UPF0755 protein
LRTLIKLLLLLIVAAGLWLAYALALPATPRQEFVLLRPGWSTRHIAMELNNAGVIRDWRAFLLYHYAAHPRSLKAGEYRFDRAANAMQVHERLARGDIFVHSVVVPEGFNIFDVASAVEAAGLGSREDFLKIAQSPEMVSDIDPKARSLEGYLFPDTYNFTRTQTMADIAETMVKRFRQSARQLGLLDKSVDLHRVVTLASIVEKETADPGERATVAAVYANRLEHNMALDADPSVIYASLLAGRNDHTIYQSDLQSDSPYNTYKYPGLPPGPIANPGRDALEATLHPAATDYLYFVADGTGNGRHRFSRTLEEQSRNVAAYRRAQANR